MIAPVPAAFHAELLQAEAHGVGPAAGCEHDRAAGDPGAAGGYNGEAAAFLLDRGRLGLAGDRDALSLHDFCQRVPQIVIEAAQDFAPAIKQFDLDA